MEGLLAVLTAFPTVVFAGLAGLCLAYWSLVLLGAADIDGLDGVAGHAHGGVEGVAASVKGIAGAVKGVAGATKAGGSVVGEALASLGLSRVPVTVTLTMFSLTGFLLSAVTRGALESFLPDVLAGLAALGVAGVGALATTSASARLLARLFEDGPVEQGGDALVGKTATITIAADDTGGQARVDGQVIVSVRSVGQRLAEGEECVLTERGEDGVFFVEPLRAHLPGGHDPFAALAPPATTEADAPVAVETSAAAAVAHASRKD